MGKILLVKVTYFLATPFAVYCTFMRSFKAAILSAKENK